MQSASLTTVLTGVNAVGLFASRAFVSAFAVAAALKWGPQIGFINNTGLLSQIHSVPSWFTHDITVTILGLLALLEIAATKSADARALLIEVDQYLKSGMAFLSTLAVSGIISANDEAVIKQIVTWQEPVRAGLGEDVLGWLVAALTAGGVYVSCVVRRNLLGVIFEADPDDDTMIGATLSWIEDLWAFFGTLLLVLFPIVMLILTTIIFGFIALLQWRAKRREENAKVACGSCGEMMYRSAVTCPSCGTANAQVHAVGWLGQSKEKLASDPQAQPVRLMQKQRCPVCAKHLEPRQMRQTCPACQYGLFESEADSIAYLATLDRRYPKVLIVTALLSLIPIVGLIPAIMVYRMRLIAPLRRYLTIARRMPLSLGLKLLFVVLIWVQVIPGVGAIAVPIMASISYGTYRRSFVKQLKHEREKADAVAV
jgi:Zn finger protein HypA/HybF involved in hydrogenase expression